MHECVPVLGIDLWEHAYIQKYGGGADGRGKYVERFLECVNWEKVSENFEKFNLAGKVGPVLA